MTTTTSTTTLAPVLQPESICLLFYVIDDLEQQFEEGINGTYKLLNINDREVAPAFFRKEKAIEDYTFQVVWDETRWVFRMFLVVNGQAGQVDEIILKDIGGNELNDETIAPAWPAKGSVKRANNDIIHVEILDENACDNVDNPTIDENFQGNFIKQSLLDHTRIPNALPRIMSGDGVEIVSLTGNHVGISFNPNQNLTGNLINFNIFGSVFRIDAAYNNSNFIVNELRTPQNNSSTVFTFLSALDYPTNIYRSSRIMDGEGVRRKLYGYS